MVEGGGEWVLDKANGRVTEIIKGNKIAQRYYNDYDKKVCGARWRNSGQGEKCVPQKKEIK